MPQTSGMCRRTDAAWDAVPDLFRRGVAPLPEPYETLFGPLRSGAVDELVVIGQLGQSLDGRIAPANGEAKFVINGPSGLVHLHRLRALVDAVVVGVGTAVADDPRLTVRHVTGPQPARVVIDPHGRIPQDAVALQSDDARKILITAEGAEPRLSQPVEILRLPSRDGRIEAAHILAALGRLGFRRILIEGGAKTMSCFLEAGCMDRLHMIVAPIILGHGQAGISLPPGVNLPRPLQLPVRMHDLGEDILFDCDLSAYRVAVAPLAR